MIETSNHIYMSEKSSVRNRMQEKQFKRMAKMDIKSHKPQQKTPAPAKKAQSIPNDTTSIMGK